MSQVLVTPTSKGAYILSLGEQGPAGPAGPAGPPGATGASYITRPAAGAIGGHRLVVGNADGTVSYADASNPAHLGKILGITIAAANDGEFVDVLQFGYIESNTWSWDTSRALLVGDGGLLVQTALVNGFVQVAGFAETPTRIFLKPREPIATI